MNIPFQKMLVDYCVPLLVLLLFTKGSLSSQMKCSSDADCQDGYCYQSGYCGSCVDCAKYFRESGPGCVRSAASCGLCKFGYQESSFTDGHPTGLCSPEEPKGTEEAHSGSYIGPVMVVVAALVLLSLVLTIIFKFGKNGRNHTEREDIEAPPAYSCLTPEERFSGSDCSMQLASLQDGVNAEVSPTGTTSQQASAYEDAVDDKTREVTVYVTESKQNLDFDGKPNFENVEDENEEQNDDIATGFYLALEPGSDVEGIASSSSSSSASSSSSSGDSVSTAPLEDSVSEFSTDDEEEFDVCLDSPAGSSQSIPEDAAVNSGGLQDANLPPFCAARATMCQQEDLQPFVHLFNPDCEVERLSSTDSLQSALCPDNCADSGTASRVPSSLCLENCPFEAVAVEHNLATSEPSLQSCDVLETCNAGTTHSEPNLADGRGSGNQGHKELVRNRSHSLSSDGGTPPKRQRYDESHSVSSLLSDTDSAVVDDISGE